VAGEAAAVVSAGEDAAAVVLAGEDAATAVAEDAAGGEEEEEKGEAATKMGGLVEDDTVLGSRRGLLDLDFEASWFLRSRDGLEMLHSGQRLMNTRCSWVVWVSLLSAHSELKPVCL